MMIRPEPRIRMLWRSVRLDISSRVHVRAPAPHVRAGPAQVAG